MASLYNPLFILKTNVFESHNDKMFSTKIFKTIYRQLFMKPIGSVNIEPWYELFCCCLQ